MGVTAVLLCLFLPEARSKTTLESIDKEIQESGPEAKEKEVQEFLPGTDEKEAFFTTKVSYISTIRSKGKSCNRVIEARKMCLHGLLHFYYKIVSF